jgi:mono/diheme cytochrome c family protein
MGWLKLQGVGFAFLALCVACAFSPVARAQGDVAGLYTAKCAACHGPDGTGSTPAGKAVGAHDFHSAAVLSQTDVQLIATVTKGKGKMPAYEKIYNADQIAALVAYCRQLGTKK